MRELEIATGNCIGEGLRSSATGRNQSVNLLLRKERMYETASISFYPLKPATDLDASGCVLLFWNEVVSQAFIVNKP